jgi:hypothetical protein
MNNGLVRRILSALGVSAPASTVRLIPGQHARVTEFLYSPES